MKRKANGVLLVFFLIIAISPVYGFVFWHFGGEKIAFHRGFGEPVKLHNESGDNWGGKQEYIKKQLMELITTSRKLGVFDENILPIKVMAGIPPGKGASAAASRSRFSSDIYLSQAHLKITHGNDYVRLYLVHEFSHLLMFFAKNAHGPEWKSACEILFYRMLPKWQEEDGPGKPYIIWPGICFG